MKVVLGAAAAVVLMCGAAFAQTEGAATAPAATLPASRCETLPPGPPAPDPAAVNANAMREAIAAFEAWQDVAEPILACRRAEAVELDATARQRTAEYNAATAQVRATQGEWQTATDAFNARRSRR